MRPSAPPGLRVFVVDDDPDILRMVSTVLRAAGYEVMTESSPIGVGAKIKRYTPHALIFDVTMPGLSGEGLAGLLSKNKKRPPVLFYSALAEEELLALTRRIPDSTYLQKGGSLSRLVDAVHRMCRLYATSSPP